MLAGYALSSIVAGTWYEYTNRICSCLKAIIVAGRHDAGSGVGRGSGHLSVGRSDGDGAAKSNISLFLRHYLVVTYPLAATLKTHNKRRPGLEEAGGY